MKLGHGIRQPIFQCAKERWSKKKMHWIETWRNDSGGGEEIGLCKGGIKCKIGALVTWLWIWDVVGIMCSRVTFMQWRGGREDPKSGQVKDYFGFKSEKWRLGRRTRKKWEDKTDCSQRGALTKQHNRFLSALGKGGTSHWWMLVKLHSCLRLQWEGRVEEGVL